VRHPGAGARRALRAGRRRLQPHGRAVAAGQDVFGQCTMPRLEEGHHFTHVAAGLMHTVLLRSDGHIVCCGEDSQGQCDVPPPEPGVRYVPCFAARDFVVQLSLEGGRVVGRSLAGSALAEWAPSEVELGRSVLRDVTDELCRPGAVVRVVTPGGDLAMASLTWAALFGGSVPRALAP